MFGHLTTLVILTLSFVDSPLSNLVTPEVKEEDL